MARQKQGVFEDLIDLAAMLPWWAGVLLALVAYFVIHPFAVEPVPITGSVQDIGQMATGQLVRTFALVGQYVVPGAFLVGALVSAIKQTKKKRLLVNTAEATDQGAVKSLSWQEFELLVGEAFRQDGYTVQETSPGADGGIDLELRKDGELHLVQCKQWRATKVGVAIVRELFGVMAGQGATHGYVVTSGSYTKEALAFADGRNITLIDGTELDAMLKRAAPAVKTSGARKAKASPVSQAAARKAPKLDTPAKNTGVPLSTPASMPAQPRVEATDDTTPACPVCGGVMVERTARRGANAGKRFWGCENFPKCRGTREL